MGIAMCGSGPGTFCISIGVARYDMVVVSKPSMATIWIGQVWAHSRSRWVVRGVEVTVEMTAEVKHAWCVSARREAGVLGLTVRLCFGEIEKSP